MRTKTLLCAAALAAGVATSMAQSNVYSLNVVGYVNVPIPVGYSLIGNPLNAGNNTVSNLFNSAVASGAAVGATVYTWTGTGLNANANDQFDGTWQNPALALPPGVGFFINNPNARFTNTFVGEVNQGALSKSVAQGYTVNSSLVPLTGNLQTDLGLTNAVPGDVAYLWSGSGLVACAKDQFDGTWQPLSPPFSSDANNGPVIQIGTGFFYQNNSGAAISWNRNFTVQ
jgi:hypothetical protein